MSSQQPKPAARPQRPAPRAPAVTFGMDADTAPPKAAATPSEKPKKRSTKVTAEANADPVGATSSSNFTPDFIPRPEVTAKDIVQADSSADALALIRQKFPEHTHLEHQLFEENHTRVATHTLPYEVEDALDAMSKAHRRETGETLPIATLLNQALVQFTGEEVHPYLVQVGRLRKFSKKKT